MKLLIDQNISHRILSLISHAFPDVQHVREHGLSNADDYDIFMHARHHRYDAVITLDDFVRLLNTYSAPPKIIWLRTGNCSTSFLAEILINKSDSIEQFVRSEEYFLYEVFKM